MLKIPIDTETTAKIETTPVPLSSADYAYAISTLGLSDESWWLHSVRHHLRHVLLSERQFAGSRKFRRKMRSCFALSHRCVHGNSHGGRPAADAVSFLWQEW